MSDWGDLFRKKTGVDAPAPKTVATVPEGGKPPPDGLKIRAITDPAQRASIERVAAAIESGRAPGKADPKDATWEKYALESSASTVQCMGCEQEVLEFWVWSDRCRELTECTLEVVRCRKCDPDGKTVRKILDEHQRAEHPQLYEACPNCGSQVIDPRQLSCRCGALAVLCRQCDPMGDYVRFEMYEHMRECPDPDVREIAEKVAAPSRPPRKLGASSIKVAPASETLEEGYESSETINTKPNQEVLIDEPPALPHCDVCGGVLDERGPDICPTGGHCEKKPVDAGAEHI